MVCKPCNAMFLGWVSSMHARAARCSTVVCLEQMLGSHASGTGAQQPSVRNRCSTATCLVHACTPHPVRQDCLVRSSLCSCDHVNVVAHYIWCHCCAQLHHFAKTLAVAQAAMPTLSLPARNHGTLQPSRHPGTGEFLLRERDRDRIA
eukprot:scaffold28790_cov18-Tisochrysis_lutea.AAC.1